MGRWCKDNVEGSYTRLPISCKELKVGAAKIVR